MIILISGHGNDTDDTMLSEVYAGNYSLSMQ